jgi:predicted DNA-binding protein (MmcQ/YjbR family)
MEDSVLNDPTQPIRERAAAYPSVDEGTACTQASFKTSGKGSKKGSAFLYIGEQGGRYKAMFKLEASLEEAEALAADAPKDYQLGKNKWVTARFSVEMPMPDARWQKWLDESYVLAGGVL